MHHDRDLLRRAVMGRVRSVTIEPEGSLWAGKVREAWGGDLDDRARVFREEMGLPTDRPVIMAGHQAEFWHPGILAKWFAAEAAAGLVDGAAAWLIADVDANPIETLRLPALGADGAVARREVALGLRADGVPTSSTPAFTPGPASLADATTPGPLAGRAEAIRAAVSDAAAMPNAAEQAHSTMTTLLGDAFAPAHVVRCSGIGRTSLFAELVERLRAEPRAAAELYNEEAARAPHTRLAPLEIGAGRVELPLWWVSDSAPRRRVFAHELDRASSDRLAPRALVMTAVVRLAGCELFIHGRGGWAYDRVMERWIRRWAGLEVAPTALVTADVTLDLPGADVSEREVAHATWRHAHARHWPGELDRTEDAQQKRELVSRIQRAEKGSAERRLLFGELQRFLEDYRRRASEPIDALGREAARAEAAMRSAGLAGARDWPAPLHDTETLTDLRSRIASRFAPVSSSR